MTSIFPHLSLADPINDKVALLVQNYGDAFPSFSLVVLKYLLVPLESGLRIMPPSVSNSRSCSRCWPIRLRSRARRSGRTGSWTVAGPRHSGWIAVR